MFDYLVTASEYHCYSYDYYNNYRKKKGSKINSYVLARFIIIWYILVHVVYSLQNFMSWIIQCSWVQEKKPQKYRHINNVTLSAAFTLTANLSFLSKSRWFDDSPTNKFVVGYGLVKVYLKH